MTIFRNLKIGQAFVLPGVDGYWIKVGPFIRQNWTTYKQHWTKPHTEVKPVPIVESHCSVCGKKVRAIGPETVMINHESMTICDSCQEGIKDEAIR